jgi:hypothetical protein
LWWVFNDPKLNTECRNIVSAQKLVEREKIEYNRKEEEKRNDSRREAFRRDCTARDSGQKNAFYSRPVGKQKQGTEQISFFCPFQAASK